MGTITEPRPQWQVALDKANDARFRAVDVKNEIKAGTLTLAEALVDPRAGSLTVFDLLTAQKRWGRQRALQALTPLFIHETKRVKTLTDRQRHLIAELV